MLNIPFKLDTYCTSIGNRYNNYLVVIKDSTDRIIAELHGEYITEVMPDWKPENYIWPWPIYHKGEPVPYSKRAIAILDKLNA